MSITVLQPDDIDFSYYLKQTDAEERVRPAIQYLSAVMHQLAPAHDAPKYARLPFFGTDMEFRPGEVTVWGGFNGAGKSMLQGQIMAEIAEQGTGVCIASFEMKPEKTLARIARQVTGKRTPKREEVDAFFKRTDQMLWLYDQQGTVNPDRIIAVVKHCAEKLNCKHIAIDSLMKCVRNFDDYNAQKNFVDSLTAASRDYNIHTHLVVHLRKGEGDEKLPTRLDISGAAAISDLVDNVLLVWRNKKKERDISAGRQIDEKHPDSILICDKQRNGDWEGRVHLYYDRDSMVFSDRMKKGVAKFL